MRIEPKHASGAYRTSRPDALRGRPGLGPILLGALLLIAGTERAFGREFAELDSLKALAASLLKRKDLGSPDAYCESYTLAQVNSCSGEQRTDSRFRVRRNGTVTRYQYRSWNEGADPALGEFRGAFPEREWRSLLEKITAMRWVDEPNTPNPSLPPAPTQAIQVLTLSDGARTAAFSVSGPAPGLINAGMDFPGRLADSATDTVWALSLQAPKIRVRKGVLLFDAEWNPRGTVPVTVAWPDPGDSHGCGKAFFEWSGGEDSETGSHTSQAQRPKGAPSAWSLKPGRAAPLQLRFPYDQPEKGKKTGKLREFGVLVQPAGAGGKIPLTLFSDRIGF
jgi:hypothetical protein